MVKIDIPRVEDFLRGTGNQSDRESTEKHEEAVQQEKKKSSRIEDWRPCVVRKQKYPFELTLKEAG